MMLAERLRREGGVPAADLERLQAGAGDDRGLADALVAEGLLAPEEADRALAEAWGAEWVDSVPDDWIDGALVERIPVEWARAHRMLPVRRPSGLAVLTRDPAPGEALQGLALALGAEPQPLVAADAEIARAIDRCYARRGEGRLAALDAGVGPADAPDGPGPATEDLLRMAEGAPVTQRLNLILLDAVRQGASDVHIEPHEDRLRVRFRVDGMLYDQPAPPRSMETALVSRIKVMARLDIAERRLPQDGMTRVAAGAREVDIRVSTVPAADGERLVLRLLPRDAAVLPLADLGMDPATQARFRALLRAPQGIVLVTGPTGSGKTTTLYAALCEVDTARLNVMTIEDPIEYRLPAISQIQVSPRIDLTFARCLRHVLRQDPDVILVGETRDLETAEIAVRASLTGHLVFTTLHTNSAAGAPVRLADMGVPPYLLSAALRGVLAQRLVRRLCSACRRAVPWTEADRRETGLEAAEAGGPHWEAVGCEACLEGYRGRVGVFEMLEVSADVAEAIRTGAPATELRRLAQAGGMTPLWSDGLARVRAGETSLAELRRAVGRAEAPGGG